MVKLIEIFLQNPWICICWRLANMLPVIPLVYWSYGAHWLVQQDLKTTNMRTAADAIDLTLYKLAGEAAVEHQNSEKLGTSLPHVPVSKLLPWRLQPFAMVHSKPAQLRTIAYLFWCSYLLCLCSAHFWYTSMHLSGVWGEFRDLQPGFL